jgi:hypothetical protein
MAQRAGLCEFARARQHNSRSGFHNCHVVLQSFAQAARIEGGLCEFARARQQRHQH